MRTWWDSREPREQVLLTILAALVGLFLLVFAVLLPAQAAQSEAQADLQRAQSDWQLVHRVAPTLSVSNANRAPFSRAALIRAAGQHGIKLARMQPGDEGALSVWIDDVSTEALYGLFEDLMTDYSVVPERVSIGADQNGALSAQFTLRPA